MGTRIYCFDTSALIQPWNSYYSPDICPQYWEVLEKLAAKGVVFCTQEVKREIQKQDDPLHAWVRERPFLFREITEQVQANLKKVLRTHRELVDDKKERSMADAWVVAHAMAEKAVVVTKEGFAPRRIKIPDVCQAYGIGCIDDVAFVREIRLKMSARLTET